MEIRTIIVWVSAVTILAVGYVFNKLVMGHHRKKDKGTNYKAMIELEHEWNRL